MKNLSNMGLKICLVIAILMGIFGTTSTVEASIFGSGTLSSLLSMGTSIMGQAGSMVASAIPSVFSLAKNVTSFVTEKIEKRLENNIAESNVGEGEDNIQNKEKEDIPKIAASKYGDVDCDGTVDDKDIELLAMHILKLQEITNEQGLANADVNSDNEIDGYDIKAINSYIKKEIQELPVKKEEFIYGDISNDGIVNIKDSVLLTRYLAKMEGYEDLDEQAKAKADINLDGKIDSFDENDFKRYLRGTYKSLPIRVDDIVYGDINDDGVVDEKDVKDINKYIAEEENFDLDEQAKARADVNLDLEINEKDVEDINKYIAKTCESLPIKAKEVMPGDIDCNGTVDEKDAILLQNYILKMQEIPSNLGLKNADVYLDDKIDEYDYNYLASYVNDLIEKIPVDPKEEIPVDPKEEIPVDPKEEIPVTEQKTGLLAQLFSKNGTKSNSLFKRLISGSTGEFSSIIGSNSSTKQKLSTIGLKGIQLVDKVMNSQMLETVVTSVVPTLITGGTQALSTIASMFLN